MLAMLGTRRGVRRAAFGKIAACGDFVRIGGPDASLELLDYWSSVAPHVKDLPPRERRLLYLRFFRDMTQAEIAEDLGISQMHVSRLLSATLQQLRDRVAEGGG